MTFLRSKKHPMQAVGLMFFLPEPLPAASIQKKPMVTVCGRTQNDFCWQQAKPKGPIAKRT